MEAAFPAEEVDRLLVHGEPDADGRQRFPSYRDLGKRFGVSHSIIADYSRQHDCLGRRQRAQEDVQRMVDQAHVEQVAAATIVTKQEMKGVLSDFVRAFWTRMKTGAVRTDSCADACQAIKLLLQLDSDADDRNQEEEEALREVQERHRALLESSKDSPFELTGLVIHAAEIGQVDPVADTLRAPADPVQEQGVSKDDPC